MDMESNDSSSVRTDPSLAEAETAYREVEFQGSGVPSAIADPGAFEGSDELPKLPLQMRSSGLRVRSLSVRKLNIYWSCTALPCICSCHRGQMVWSSTESCASAVLGCQSALL